MNSKFAGMCGKPYDTLDGLRPPSLPRRGERSQGTYLLSENTYETT